MSFDYPLVQPLDRYLSSLERASLRSTTEGTSSLIPSQLISPHSIVENLENNKMTPEFLMFLLEANRASYNELLQLSLDMHLCNAFKTLYNADRHKGDEYLRVNPARSLQLLECGLCVPFYRLYKRDPTSVLLHLTYIYSRGTMQASGVARRDFYGEEAIIENMSFPGSAFYHVRYKDGIKFV